MSAPIITHIKRDSDCNRYEKDNSEKQLGGRVKQKILIKEGCTFFLLLALQQLNKRIKAEGKKKEHTVRYLEVSISSQPQAIARSTEVFTHGRDESHRASKTRNPVRLRINSNTGSSSTTGVQTWFKVGSLNFF